MTRSVLVIVVCCCAGLAGCGAGDEPTGRGRPGRGGSAAASGRLGSAGSFNPGGPVGIAGSGSVTPIPGGGGPTTDPSVCAEAMVSAERINPTVYLVLDGSGSMNANFGGGGSRWQVLRQTLLGPEGVVTKLESVVKFGMTIYSNNDPMKCPALSEVAPALDNLKMIAPAFPMTEPGGGTPTGEALQRVVDSLPAFNGGPDSDTQPPIIILATDGEPNGCANAATCNWIDWANCLGMLLGQLATAPATYDSTLAAVRKAKEKGIPVWVISLASGLAQIPDLQRTANIGAGLADNASPGATIYSPQNPNELTNTLSKLIGDVVSCDVTLRGTLAVERACEGTVKMNGEVLKCDDPEGWKAVDSKRIVLQGQACARFKSDPSVLLDARFPCGVVTPL